MFRPDERAAALLAFLLLLAGCGSVPGLPGGDAAADATVAGAGNGADGSSGAGAAGVAPARPGDADAALDPVAAAGDEPGAVPPPENPFGDPPPWAEPLQLGDWDGALAALSPYLADEDLHPAVALHAGIAFLELGDLESAGTYLAAVPPDAPGAFEAHNRLGVIARREGRLADAERFYKAALRLRPDYAHACFNLAVLYDRHLGRKDDALHYYRRFLELSPDAPVVQAWVQALVEDGAGAAGDGSVPSAAALASAPAERVDLAGAPRRGR